MVQIKYKADSMSEVTLDDGQNTMARNTVSVGGGVEYTNSVYSNVTLPSGKKTTAMNVVNVNGGGSGGDTTALENAVSILNAPLDLGAKGNQTEINLNELTAVADIDGRPNNKQPGATVYGLNGSIGIIDTVDTDSAIVTTVVASSTATGTDIHGIRGDYCSQYGIVDYESDEIATTTVGSNNIQINAGLTLKVQGNGGLIYIASTDTHQTTSTTDFVLVYADGSYLECDVYWQADEPADNGQGRYQAWQNGTEWKFRSNDTGNVWRATENVQPLLDVHFTNGSVTRVDPSPYALLNPNNVATRSYVESLLGNIEQRLAQI